MSLSSSLRWLATRGNQIVEAASGRPVLLRGVNRSGLEYSEPREDGFLGAAGLTEREIDYIVGAWGAAIVRLPVNQDWALNGRRLFSACAYLEAVDQVIAWGARRGAYTLLALQWLDADTPRGTGRDRRVNRVAALPDAGSIHLWQTLARRYREEPAVLYDVFSEPHTPLGDDLSTLVVPGPGGELVHLGDRRVTMEVWQAWASRLLETIRAEDPRTLVFLSGIDWGYDLRGMPVRPGGEPLPGVVYSTHVYPWSGPTGLMHAARGWTDRTRLRRAWDAAFGCLAAGVPVFVTEWGGGPGDRRWGTRLLHYMQQRRLGWTAWSWRDRPRLVEPPGDETAEPAPTPFGALVRQALAERCP